MKWIIRWDPNASFSDPHSGFFDEVVMEVVAASDIYSARAAAVPECRH